MIDSHLDLNYSCTILISLENKKDD